MAVRCVDEQKKQLFRVLPGLEERKRDTRISEVFERRLKMKKKGFTLVELLVVIAIIAMLLAILMPALGKARQLAYRLMCGTNQSGIGKAMLIYSNDYDEEFPIAGKTNAPWYDSSGGAAVTSFNWDDPDFVFQSTTQMTVSSSLYLLIKYADVSAAQFTCQAGDEKKFEIDTTDAGLPNGTNDTDLEITECWDFGDEPWLFLSYSYQLPYGDNPISAASPAGLALIADRSPWFDDENVSSGLFDQPADNDDAALSSGFIGLDPQYFDDSQKMKYGNSAAHQQDGQNVLYGDGHVTFEKTTNVGIEEDNIYTIWTDSSPTNEEDTQLGDDISGMTPGAETMDSMDSDDSFLVNDGKMTGSS